MRNRNKQEKSGNGGSQLVTRRREREMEPFGRDWMDPFGVGWPTLMRSPLSLFERGAWRQPAVDIRDLGDNYEVTVELPGIKRENVELNVTDDRLEVRARETTEKEREEEGYYHREIGSRSFYRSVPLPPDANPEEVEAELEDGCLCVTIEKDTERETTRGRRVPIK